MIIGIFTMVLFLFTSSKFITMHMKFDKADHFFVKIHKSTGIMLIIVAMIHLVISFSLVDTRPFIIYILGIISLFCMIIVAASYFFRKKLGSKWLKIHRNGTLVILVIIAIHIIMVMNSLTDYKNAVNDIAFEDIQVSDLSDGEYEGEYDVGYIYAKVKVTVQSGSITDIELLEHQNERGQAAEMITDRIVEEQRIDVDAVSGATNSSKVIKKAVETALFGGIKYEDKENDCNTRKSKR